MQRLAIMDLSEEFMFRKEVKITSGMLLENEPFPNTFVLKIGLIIKSKGFSWPVYKTWIEKIHFIECSTEISHHITVESQKAKLVRSTNREGELNWIDFCVRSTGYLANYA
jgi:hypothetical protein